MKVAVLSVLLILAGTLASPPQFNESSDIVTNLVRNIIIRISEHIKNSGYDPLDISRFAYEYIGNFFQFKFDIEDLHFSGASNIVIRRLFNNVLLSTFDFDVVVPQMNMRIGNSGLEVGIGEKELSGELSGW
ncbi:uncharacterized protein LOC123663603 [Melitaea cinxia]|uniref:uncharacterized protein LOC123663603 n=1 Tax=Melitaea cinxia TaxID=113334 RepID=UPI001E272A02|nr:uncharacterized protein LOC123663603 [Melitaea cinxia]